MTANYANATLRLFESEATDEEPFAQFHIEGSDVVISIPNSQDAAYTDAVEIVIPRDVFVNAIAGFLSMIGGVPKTRVNYPKS